MNDYCTIVRIMRYSHSRLKPDRIFTNVSVIVCSTLIHIIIKDQKKSEEKQCSEEKCSCPTAPTK